MVRICKKYKIKLKRDPIDETFWMSMFLFLLINMCRFRGKIVPEAEVEAGRYGRVRKKGCPRSRCRVVMSEMSTCKWLLSLDDLLHTIKDVFVNDVTNWVTWRIHSFTWLIKFQRRRFLNIRPTVNRSKAKIKKHSNPSRRRHGWKGSGHKKRYGIK